MGLADDAQNKAEELKGQAKEAAGAATGNDDLKHEGKAEQFEADVKKKVADVADKVKEGVNDIKAKLTGK